MITATPRKHSMSPIRPRSVARLLAGSLLFTAETGSVTVMVWFIGVRAERDVAGTRHAGQGTHWHIRVGRANSSSLRYFRRLVERPSVAIKLCQVKCGCATLRRTRGQFACAYRAHPTHADRSSSHAQPVRAFRKPLMTPLLQCLILAGLLPQADTGQPCRCRCLPLWARGILVSDPCKRAEPPAQTTGTLMGRSVTGRAGDPS